METKLYNKKGSLAFDRMIKMTLLSIAATVIVLMSFYDSHAAVRDVEWGGFQGNENHNGVTDILMPADYSETALKWGKRMVFGYTDSFTPPIIVDGYLMTASGKKVYKINKDTGSIIDESEEMSSNVSYAMHPITYDSEYDQYYVPLMHGRVACIDAETLSVKWESEALPGYQSLSPIACKNGIVYSGTWAGEQVNGVFYALNANNGKKKWEFRPSEQRTVTVAEDLGDFPIATGSTESHYTCTALIKMTAKSGFEFGRNDIGTVYLYQNGKELGDKIPASVNGINANMTLDDDTGVVTMRVIYTFANGEYKQFGAEGEGGFALTGLEDPVVGQPLDKSLDSSDKVDVQSIEWKTGDVPHGFYWAGAYTDGSHVFFGSDDGQDNSFATFAEGTYTCTATFYSLDCQTGRVTDRIDGCRGDIRSTAVKANGHIYFTTKGGELYKAKVNSNGTFDHDYVSKFRISSMMTASPVVHNGRIYVGIAGSGAQFGADGGHKFGVFRNDEKLSGEYNDNLIIGNNPSNIGSLIYTTDIAGYPQASALLSTNTEGESGDVRLYFTYNAPPGGLYYLEDSPSTTNGTADILFRPENEMQQHSLTPICVDRQGTMYLKNDSGYMMAVALNKAWADGVSIEYDNKELTWEGGFESGTLNYKLRAPNEAKSVDITLDLPSGVTAEIGTRNSDGSIVGMKSYTGTKQTVSIPEDFENEAIVVVVSKTTGTKTYSRTYAFKVVPNSNNANVSGIVINNNNSAPVIPRTTDENYPEYTTEEGEGETIERRRSKWFSYTGLGYDPLFDINTTKYVSRTINNDKLFANVWFQKDDPKATVKVYSVEGVGNAADKLNSDDWTIKLVGRGPYRAPVYWVKGKISAEVRIEVTSPSGNEVKSYNVELVRDKKYKDIGAEPLVLSKNTASLNTKGGNTATRVSAYWGTENVTDKCVWSSSKPDIVTVDTNGNVAATGKPGEAVVWAKYLGQSTEETPLFVSVTGPTASAPTANLSSGTYFEKKQIFLSSLSGGAEIRYNIGESQDVAYPTSTSGTVYKDAEPILLGEDGAIKTYRIRAIACNGGYFNDSTSASTFDYTIDLRRRVAEAGITGLDAPEAGEPLDQEVSTLDSNMTVKSIQWFMEDGEESTPVTGAAEGYKDYKAVITLGVDSMRDVFTDSTKGSINGEAVRTQRIDDLTLTLTKRFKADSTIIDMIEIDGINAPSWNEGFDNEITLLTQNMIVDRVYWTDENGAEVTNAPSPGAKYIVNVLIYPDNGCIVSDNVSAWIKKDGSFCKAELEKEDDKYRVSLDYVVPKLKVSNKGNNILVEPSSITGLKHGAEEKDIRAALSTIRTKVLMEDGSYRDVTVYWKAEPKKEESGRITGDIEYDPRDYRKQTFVVSGEVTNLSEEELGGVVLIPSVVVTVDQGEVKPPVFSPKSGVYTQDQIVSIVSESPGAAIYFTRSDKSGTETYVSPINISAEFGQTKAVTFKAYAMANGIKSETVTYTIEIDKKTGSGPDINDDTGDSSDSTGRNESSSKVKAGGTYKAGSAIYKVSKVANSKTKGIVTFTKSKNAKSVTVPATVKLSDGKVYIVDTVSSGAFKGKKIKTVTIGKNIKRLKKNAFKGSKAKTLIVKTKKLKKSSVKGCLKGSKVSKVKVKVGSKKMNKKFVKKYKKIFTKKNVGRKVKVSF